MSYDHRGSGELTEDQFADIDTTVSNLLRKSRRGTPERANAERIVAEWEAAYQLPQRTVTDRERRRAAIAAVARRHGLV